MTRSNVPGPDLTVALASLPIFPLPHVVLFPGARMPLHIFEPRYRQMTRDLLDGHRALAIVQVVRGDASPNVDAHGQPRIAQIAGVGVVIEAEALPDGRFNILIEGRLRARLHELPFVSPYRRARAEPLEDSPTDVGSNDRSALIAIATAFTTFVRSREPEFGFIVPSQAPPSRLADICAHHLVLDPDERQALLETLDPEERVRNVAASLASQLALFRNDPPTILN